MVQAKSSEGMTWTPSGEPLVLLVDDEPSVLSALRRLLRREPYEIATAERPGEALAWVEWGRVSLVIADQRMPDMSGADLLEAIQSRSPQTIRMMLTSYPESGPLKDWRERGIRRIVTKPWNDEDLKETIRGLLAEATV